jgi:L-ornithine N5-oxygenase
MSKVYDIVGVGFGPANIALAALLEEERAYENVLFLEGAKTPLWQSEMLFENALDIHSNIQNIPHRDLATLRSPRSRFTFLNYLHETGLLLEHLNMDLLMPMRPDFAAYIRWVAQELSHLVRTGKAVRGVSMLDEVHSHVYRIETYDGDAIFARHVVLGTGRDPLIPEVFEESLETGRVFHLTRFNSSSRRLIAEGARKFAVIGSSQSAVEILLQLSKVEPRLELHSIFRRFAYPLKDTSPFMSEIYFPQFTDLYYNADKELKRRIDRDVVRTNYGACDMDVLEELYRQIYYDRLRGQDLVRVRRMSEVRAVEADESGVTLVVQNHETGRTERDTFDGVVLATGFRNIGPGRDQVRVPAILRDMTEAFALDADGCVSANREYLAALRPDLSRAGGLVLNGLCETSHGMGDAGSVSLLSLRAQTIVEALRAKDAGVARCPRTGMILDALAGEDA